MMEQLARSHVSRFLILGHRRFITAIDAMRQHMYRELRFIRQVPIDYDHGTSGVA
jgi:hypothetical protein